MADSRVGLLLGFAALVVFGYDLASEPRFMDESAYLSQAFYADLFLSARWDDPLWLEYPAVDLPPLPKYLIGVALRTAGHPRPAPARARAWYAVATAVGSDEDLFVARIPSALLGSFGCVALFALGTIAGDRRIGVLAAVLLMMDPLYRIHARRAMSDVPCESFTLMTAAVGLWAWKRTLNGEGGAKTLLAAPSAGICAGLATLSKLTGGLSVMILVAWSALGAMLPTFAVVRKARVLAGGVIACAAAYLVFVALNPFLWSHPKVLPTSEVKRLSALGLIGRTKEVVEFRGEVSRVALGRFPKDALRTTIDKVVAVAAQGFGRFGPFGPPKLNSEQRIDRVRDRGALMWIPLVVTGLALFARRGLREFRSGQAPVGWAIVVQWLVACATVTLFIPLAWDRYFLALQPISALVGAATLVLGFDALAGRFGIGKGRAVAA